MLEGVSSVMTQEHYCKINQFWCPLAMPVGMHNAGPHLQVSGPHAALTALVSVRFGIRVLLENIFFISTSGLLLLGYWPVTRYLLHICITTTKTTEY